MHPVGIDRVLEAVRTGELSIGWWKVGSVLLDPGLSRAEFAGVVHRSVYYGAQANRRSSGNAAGQLWRFNREMRHGALVVVPHGDPARRQVIGSPRIADIRRLVE
jgi:predicted Mrr-cat superfamily restriction endonuclease